MLVRFEDFKGAIVWVNPVYIRALKAGKKYTEVHVVPGAGVYGALKLEKPIDEVAMEINVAMLAGLGDSQTPPPGADAAGAANPAVNAAMMG